MQRRARRCARFCSAHGATRSSNSANCRCGDSPRLARSLIVLFLCVGCADTICVDEWLGALLRCAALAYGGANGVGGASHVEREQIALALAHCAARGALAWECVEPIGARLAALRACG